MPLTRPEYADLHYFLVVSRVRSFSRASVELGVSSSALSHALKSFEERLGVRLLNRTTRSVTLTAAGEQLLAAIDAPLAALDEALEGLNRFRDSPAGLVRLNVMQDAALHLLAPVMPTLTERYPDVHIDIAINNRIIDVTSEGFDAGIRYGGTVPEDMVTQVLSAPIPWIVAASPAYLERFGAPRNPDDLQKHRCIGIRLGTGRVYQWEFDRDGKSVSVSVPSAITIDDGPIAIALAEGGVGLVYGSEPAVADRITSGKLRLVMEDWRSFGPPFHIYYSSRRQVPQGLRVLIELIREMKPLGL